MKICTRVFCKKIKRTVRRGELLQRWTFAALGKSYWHLPQGVGKLFVPGKLKGYYNDLTPKVQWKGLLNEEGLPLNEFQGRKILFPTTLFQKALGHWDLWLASGQRAEKHLDEFLKIATWATLAQDEQGGWKVWPLLGLNYISPYSAMTQGEGISVLVRAYHASQKSIYLEKANQALRPMQKVLEEGGTIRETPEGIVLEEVPAERYRAILNGWIFALFGLYDYLLVASSPVVHQILQKSLRALVSRLYLYDAGYWSYYDLSGHLASPFYHSLHIAQLEALSLTFPYYAGVFHQMRAQFVRQKQNLRGKIKAVVLKAYQKLKEPPEVVLR